jgi:hypothetical protein
MTPRADQPNAPSWPFDIYAWDLDALVEIRPEGNVSTNSQVLAASEAICFQDRTVMTVGIEEIAIYDTTSASSAMNLFRSVPNNALVGFLVCIRLWLASQRSFSALRLSLCSNFGSRPLQFQKQLPKSLS